MSFLAYSETVKPCSFAAARSLRYSSFVKRSPKNAACLSAAAFFGLPRFFMDLLLNINQEKSILKIKRTP